MPLLSIFKPKGKNGFGYSSTAESVTEEISLRNKIILITGCNSGLGQETVRVLAFRGARIVGTARTIEKARASLSIHGENHKGLACDLADPDSIKKCIVSLKNAGLSLDAVICNAGIMALPKLEKVCGYERQFFTNHIGHFMLVNGILDLMAEDCRVIVLSSSAHKNAPSQGIEFENLSGDKLYMPWRAYGQSKLANILFAKELARRFKGTKRTAYAVHPGIIRTNLIRNMHPLVDVMMRVLSPLFLKSVSQGAATQCYLASSPSVSSHTGKYFADCNLANPRKDAEDPVLAGKLWDISEKIVRNL